VDGRIGRDVGRIRRDVGRIGRDTERFGRVAGRVRRLLGGVWGRGRRRDTWRVGRLQSSLEPGRRREDGRRL
jgi:hypothetical protein